MLQLVGRKNAENITLIFRIGVASVQFEFAIVAGQNCCVVTGADRIKTESKRLLKQSRKLDALVATHTRIRRAPSLVFGNEIVDYFFFELLAEIPDVVGNAENVRRALRIHAVFDCAATARAGAQSARHAREG